MLEIVGLLQNKINQKYNRTDMFGYRSGIPKVRFETKRMIVRLAYERDAEKLANYYT
ncbi:30S ribosomal protein S5 alanine N-acetyltransferase, partial [Proteus mirabilis]